MQCAGDIAIIVFICISLNNVFKVSNKKLIFWISFFERCKQVVETSVTVNNNSPIQDYVHPDDQTQPTFENDSWVQTFHNLYTLTVILFM